LQKGKKAVHQNHSQNRNSELRQIDAGNETEQGRYPKQYGKEAKQVAQELKLPGINARVLQQVGSVVAQTVLRLS
jgi:hypothetical protein